MSKVIYSSGHTTLNGHVSVSGSKNASLPIIAACLLFNKPVHLKNIARLDDITTLLRLLSSMNVKLTFKKDSLLLDPTDARNVDLSQKDVGTIRASILLLGPILARFGSIKLPLPGGCSIGKRPVNFHLEALRALGATVSIEQNMIIGSAPKGLKGGSFSFPKPSVTATENALLAATLAKGQTTLHQASIEPEVLELVRFLQEAGVKITQHQSTITIEPSADLLVNNKPFTVLSDRMEVGTWIAAAGITRGKISIGFDALSDLDVVLSHARAMGMKIKKEENTFFVDASGPLMARSFTTGFGKLFPTDLQAPFAALNLTCDGPWSITETVWEDRFDHLKQAQLFGASALKFSQNTASYPLAIKPTLHGAVVTGNDLRGTCALAILSLAASGPSTILQSQHIGRGYQYFIEKINTMGATLRQEPLIEHNEKRIAQQEQQVS